MVVCEDSFEMKKRNVHWSPSYFTASTIRMMPLYATAILPTPNRSVAVILVGVAAPRILLPTPIQRLAARRLYTQERSGLQGLTRAFGVSGTTVSSWIRKSSLASFLMHNLASP